MKVFRLVAAAVLVTVALAGTAFGADRTNGTDGRTGATVTTTTAAPGTTAPVTATPEPTAPPAVDAGAGGQMTLSVDVPCVRPKLQHCDPAHPDARSPGSRTRIPRPGSLFGPGRVKRNPGCSDETP